MMTEICMIFRKFPFLIGKVLTIGIEQYFDKINPFPFLIGKVLTTAFKPLL